jgi:all-trans-8'-apo-beta-carotenal 15,15'-oxygenase
MDDNGARKTAIANPSYAAWPRAFSDIQREHGFEPLRVQGRLPDDLSGTLYFNGPGSFHAFGEHHPFWLDADGATSAFRIAGGQASGAVKMVRTRSYLAEQRAQRRLYARFERRSPRPFRELFGGERRNPGNTSVWHVQDRLYALCQAGSPVRIDPDDLSSLGEYEFPSVGKRPLSAHASYCRARQAFYNFALVPGRQPTLELFEFPDSGGDRLVARVPLPAASFVHDFMVTSRHALFVVPPFRIEALPMLLQLRTLSQCLHYRPEQPAEVIVVALDAPHTLTRIELPACFVLHFANAFEQGSTLVADAPVSHDAQRTWRWLTALGRGQSVPRPEVNLQRLHVDLNAARARWEALSDACEEQPRISPWVENAPHRYIYTVGLTGDHTGLPNVLRKTDIAKHVARQLDFGSETYPSEPVFVPRSAARDEDDGYLLSLVYDAKQHASQLVVLDAATFDAEPLARLVLGQHVPPPFHGTWLDERWSAPHPFQQ